MASTLNDANFQEGVAKGIVLVDFWAPWCGPCKQMNPIIERIATKNPDLIIAKVDIDESPQIATKFNILSIPTIIIFKDGEPKEQTVGVVSEKTILDKIARLK